MQHPTRLLFLVCGLIVPMPLTAQLAATPGPALLLIPNATPRPMRQSMVARYATITSSAPDTLRAVAAGTVVLRQLLRSALTLMAVPVRPHPLIAIGTDMVHHDQ